MYVLYPPNLCTKNQNGIRAADDRSLAIFFSLIAASFFQDKKKEKELFLFFSKQMKKKNIIIEFMSSPHMISVKRKKEKKM